MCELKYYLHNLVKCLNRFKILWGEKSDQVRCFFTEIDGLVMQNDANQASNIQNKLG